MGVAKADFFPRLSLTGLFGNVSPELDDLFSHGKTWSIGAYFEVLEAQQQLFPAEISLAQTRRDQLVAVVNLYRALGGGWQAEEQAGAVAHREGEGR